MFFSTWLRNWKRTRRGTRPPGPSYLSGRCRLGIEVLEDRCLLSGGVLDQTFGSHGIVGTNVGNGSTSSPQSVAIYANAGTINDGKIVAAGYTYDSSNLGVFAVARYTAAGALDPTWGSNGLVTTSFGRRTAGFAFGAGIQGDGKVLLAGTSSSAFTLARYNSNGSLDTSFGNNGIGLTHFGKKSSDLASDLAIQPDGKIIAAGRSDGNVALARYNTNGSPDTSFGPAHTGLVTTAFASPADSGWNKTLDMALYPSISPAEAGKIVVVEQLDLSTTPSASDSVVVIRYNANGTLDTTFNGIGEVTINSANFPSVALQSNDDVVVSYNSTNSNPAALQVVRFNPNGSMDTSFSFAGIPLSGPGLVNTHIRDTTIQANGQILVAGYYQPTNNGGFEPHYFFVTRVNANGGLDTTFGTGGVATPWGAKDAGSYPVSLALDANGNIVLAGTAGCSGMLQEFAVLRMLPTGLAVGPEIGAFIGPASSVGVGNAVTLTVGNITDTNSGATITQVAFYVDSDNNGVLDSADTLLSYGTQTSPGEWTLSSANAFGLSHGNYTVFAQAEDSGGVFGDPFAITLAV